MNILLIPLLLCSAVLFTTLTIGISIAWVWIMGYAAYELVISAIRLTHYMKGKARLFISLKHACVRKIRQGMEWMTEDMPHFLWYIVAPLLLVLYLLWMWLHYAKK